MPRLPIQRVSLLYLLSEQSYEDDSGKALEVLYEDYTKAFGEYKWNNFYQLFHKLASEKLVETVSEPRKVYLIELTQLGRNYLSDNRRHLPLAREARSEVYEPRAPRLPEQTPQEHAPVDDALKLVEQTIEVLASLLKKARSSEEASSKADELSDQVSDLLMKLRRVEARNLELLAEIDSLRAKLPKAQKSLRASQLPKIWRDLAQKALSQGWTIQFNKSGHIKWVSPTGKEHTSASTPSDHRAVMNSTSDMKKLGLDV